MRRAYLGYLGYLMEVPRGRCIIGRATSCLIRPTDPTVSRQHLRLRFGDQGLFAEDLDTHNGTQLNGRPMVGWTRLSAGDELLLGSTALSVRVVEDERAEDDTPTAPLSIPPDLSPASWSASGDPGWATAHTEPTPLPVARSGKRAPRHDVNVPVIYASENLTVESTALNLSRSGVFLHTQILDEVGTQCVLTFCPASSDSSADAGERAELRGRVVRVVEQPNRGGPTQGLGIEFTHLPDAARRWLEAAVSEAAAPR